MGFYLAAATLNQAALAQGRAQRAAVCWIACALAYVGWNLLPCSTSSDASRSGLRSPRRSCAAALPALPCGGGSRAMRPDSPERSRPGSPRPTRSARGKRPARALHDAELILVAGALLAVGIAAAKVADRVRVPGLLLFLGLGMLVGSEGIGGVEFNDAELTRHWARSAWS